MQIDKIFDYRLNQILNQKSKSFFFKKFITAVSGGSDSSVLSYLAEKFSMSRGIPHTSVIIDHKIRKNSSKEAKLVLKRLRSINIESKIIKINQIPPKNGIQKWCRVQRFSILSKLARKECAIVILGHHLDDQAETVLMRLNNNSGLIGLSGINEEVFFEGVLFVRPLLEIRKKQILDFCKKKSLKFVNDPSNLDLKFERVRARKLITSSSKLILKKDFLRLRNSSIIIKKHIYKIIDLWIKKNAKLTYPLYARLNKKEFEKLPFLAKQLIFSKILKKIGNSVYLPSFKSISCIINSISLNQNKTLSGCQIISKKNEILVFIEYGREINEKQKIKKGEILFFDKRWLIKTNYEGYIQKLGKVPKILPNNLSFLPKEVISIIPVLVTLEELIIYPYFMSNINGIYNANINYNDNNLLIWAAKF